MYNETQVDIHNDKTSSFLGTAYVDLRNLRFPYSRDIDTKNVQRLEKTFKVSGCCPENFNHRIPAIISPGNLESLCLKSNVQMRSEDQSPPYLNCPSGMEILCLRGAHRVKAAAVTSRTSWVIDFFSSHIREDTKRDLVEEYANEKPPDDGEIYYKLRLYQGHFGPHNPFFEAKWLARLDSTSNSKNKRDRFIQITGNPIFGPEFDSFQYIPSIYGGLRLSVLNKVVSMSCHEEVIQYLRNVKAFWYSLLNNDERLLSKLDRQAVGILQLRAPGACENEARQVYACLEESDFFKMLDTTQRNSFWEKLLVVTRQTTVPSLFSFFEDLKYLQVIAGAMKKLVTIEGGQTMRRAFFEAYDQTIDMEGCALHDSRKCNFEIAYRRLLLFAALEFEDMPAVVSKRLAGRAPEVNEVTLHEFATLAQRLGFKSQRIENLVEQNPLRPLVRKLLSQSRRLSTNDDNNRLLVTQITKDISTPLPVEPKKYSQVEIEAETRCGIPHAKEQEYLRGSLTLSYIYHTREPTSQISTRFVRASIFRSFFPDDIQGCSKMSEILMHQNKESSVEDTFTLNHAVQNDCSEMDCYESPQAELQKELTTLRHEKQSLENEIQKSLLCQREMEKEQQKLNQASVDGQKQCAEIERQKFHMQQEIQSLRVSQQEMTRYKQFQEAELQTIHQKSQKLQQTIVEESEKFEVLLKKNQSLQNETQHLQELLETLHQDQCKKDKLIEALSQKISQQSAESSSLEAKTIELKQELNVGQTSLENLQETERNLRGACESISASLSGARGELENVQSSIRKHEEAERVLNSNTQKLQQEITRLYRARDNIFDSEGFSERITTPVDSDLDLEHSRKRRFNKMSKK